MATIGPHVPIVTRLGDILLSRAIRPREVCTRCWTGTTIFFYRFTWRIVLNHQAGDLHRCARFRRTSFETAISVGIARDFNRGNPQAGDALMRNPDFLCGAA
jgi:hypothetical protein